MATVRRRRRDMAAGRLPSEMGCGYGEEGIGLARAIDLFDRPLRTVAGDDLPLLQIYRCTAVGALAAALGAVVIGAFT